METALSLGNSSSASLPEAMGDLSITSAHKPHKLIDLSVPDKVIIWFRPTGGAPVLKQSKFKISTNQRFQAAVDFLRRQLHYASTDPLILYINSTFAPALDEHIANLFRCFGVDGVLVINYSTTPAWG